MRQEKLGELVFSKYMQAESQMQRRARTGSEPRFFFYIDDRMAKHHPHAPAASPATGNSSASTAQEGKPVGGEGKQGGGK